MGKIADKQLDAIVEKAKALAGDDWDGFGEMIAGIVCDLAMAHCCRDDIPEEMEGAVAELLVRASGTSDGVESVTRGDTTISYVPGTDGMYGIGAMFTPWRRLGTLRED